jgi:hypothetical protein
VDVSASDAVPHENPDSRSPLAEQTAQPGLTQLRLLVQIRRDIETDPVIHFERIRGIVGFSYIRSFIETRINVFKALQQCLFSLRNTAPNRLCD